VDPVRPLLLVDVDGVISLFGFEAGTPPAGHWLMVDGTPHLLSATAGEHLRRLAACFDLVWCTNEYLPHALRLAGPLPHLCFASSPQTARTHWKLGAIDEHAGSDRAIARVDDDFNDACRAWAAARPGPTLLIATEPHVGLTTEHVAALEDWARAQAERATVDQMASP
jgi:hypothetical protein